MLERIENVNEQVIEKMFLLYAESMADMEREFKDRDEMEASYAAFLKEFIENQSRWCLLKLQKNSGYADLGQLSQSRGNGFLRQLRRCRGIETEDMEKN